MHRRPARPHRDLGSSIARLNARDPPATVPHHPPDSVSSASPLPSSEPSGTTRSSTLPKSRLNSLSTNDARSHSRVAGASSTSVSRNPVNAGSSSSAATSTVPHRSTPRASPTALPSRTGSSSAVSSSSTHISRNPISVEAGTCTSTSAVLDTCTSGILATGIPSPSQYSLGSALSPASTTFSPPTITTSTAISSGRHLSGRTIADIVIVSLFSLLALILVVVGRYLIARSAERRRQSLGHRSSSTDLIIIKNEGPCNSAVLGEKAPTSRQSSLSSFVTNFDQELSGVRSPGVVPDLPPLAEIRERNPVVISTGGTTVGMEPMNGMLNSDNPDYRYPSVLSQDHLEPSTRTSLPPFSFSESFAFPRPPVSSSFTTDSFYYPGTQNAVFPRSSATHLPLSAPPRAFLKDHPPSVSTPPYPRISTSSTRLPPPIALASAPVPPLTDFEDPGFTTVKVIHRSFRPSQVDELAVLPGDRIRLLRIFDDGWAFIEKLASPEGGRHEHGLIPVDCLREASQAFLTQQRVSIYGPG